MIFLLNGQVMLRILCFLQREARYFLQNIGSLLLISPACFSLEKSLTENNHSLKQISWLLFVFSSRFSVIGNQLCASCHKTYCKPLCIWVFVTVWIWLVLLQTRLKHATPAYCILLTLLHLASSLI